MTEDKLRQAIALLKAGNRPGAWQILAEIVRVEPRNETAWLWFAGAVETADQKRLCLKRALEINPNNQTARLALQRLEPDLPQPSLTDLNISPSAAPAAAGIPVTGMKPSPATRLPTPVPASRRPVRSFPGRNVVLVSVGILMLVSVGILGLIAGWALWFRSIPLVINPARQQAVLSTVKQLTIGAESNISLDEMCSFEAIFQHVNQNIMWRAQPTDMIGDRWAVDCYAPQTTAGPTGTGTATVVVLSFLYSIPDKRVYIQDLQFANTLAQSAYYAGLGMNYVDRSTTPPSIRLDYNGP